MLTLKREQMIALGILAAVALVCLGGIGAGLATRYGAQRDNAEKHDILAKLETHARREAGTLKHRVIGTAPASAFLNAPTQGAAGAQLEAYLARVSNRRAVLISSAIQPAAQNDGPETIRVEATLDLSSSALQELLYRLEMDEPYVFVDSLQVRMAGRTTQQAAEDPRLRVTLNLHAIWRRGKA
jgi:hypothetical protein